MCQMKNDKKKVFSGKITEMRLTDHALYASFGLIFAETMLY